MFSMFSALISILFFCLFVYGLYLAFRASILLGIITLFIPPAGIVFAVGFLGFKADLPQTIVDRLKKGEYEGVHKD